VATGEVVDRIGYEDGTLRVEGLSVGELAGKFGTPLFIYSKKELLSRLERMKQAFSAVGPTICFAVKSLSNIHILTDLAAAGCGFDIVSGGELYRVREAGADMRSVVYAGVGKTDRELSEAIGAGVGLFNVESEEELAVLEKIAQERGARVEAALRINPDIDPGTHDFISTGKKETKFGIDIDRAFAVFDAVKNSPSVHLCGIHFHLGSGGHSAEPYAEAARTGVDLVCRLRSRGHELRYLDLGGGFGNDYLSGESPAIEEYASAIVPHIKGTGLRLILEPGKSIAANSGILVGRVLFRKQGGSKTFIILDAGMNDLIRPPLYGAFHFIWPAEAAEDQIPLRMEERMDLPGLEKVDVVGPICESSDFFAKERYLPHLERGDLLAIFSAGAYGSAMSSNYNSRGLLPEVLVDGNEAVLIRRRQDYEDLLGLERLSGNNCIGKN